MECKKSNNGATPGGPPYSLDQENRILRERHDHVCGLLHGLLKEMERKERMWHSREQRLKYRVSMLECELEEARKMLVKASEDSPRQITVSEDEQEPDEGYPTIFDFDDLKPSEQGCSEVIAEEMSITRRLSSSSLEKPVVQSGVSCEKKDEVATCTSTAQHDVLPVKNKGSDFTRATPKSCCESHSLRNPLSDSAQCHDEKARSLVQSGDLKQPSTNGTTFFRSFRLRGPDDNSTTSTASASFSSASVNIALSETVRH